MASLDIERRRLASLERKRSVSKGSAKSKKRLEKIRQIEVQYIDCESMREEGSGADTDRIIET